MVSPTDLPPSASPKNIPCASLLPMTQVFARSKQFLSDKVEHFTESVIREMTRQAMQYNAVNLAQGFPDFPAPAEIKRAAQQAIESDVNQYAITWGAKSLRTAIAKQMQDRQGIEVDPEKEVVVCCGSTEAMIAILLAICNVGDEVGGFQPFYENYGPDAILSGAKPRYVSLRPPQQSGGEWTFDEQELRHAFQRHTKAIIVNTPTPRRIQCARHHRRNIRAHSLPRFGTHFPGSTRWHARPNHHHQRAFKKLQRDRMASGLGGCAARNHERHSQSARFFNRRRPCAITGGGSSRVESASELLPRISGTLPDPPRSPDSGA